MMTKLTAAAVLTASLATATTARAQPGMAPAAPVMVEVEVEAAPEELKSPSTATALALAGTLVPLLMVGSGDEDLIGAGVLLSTVTPSMGHWYAGKVFTPGMGARAAGGGLMFVGLLTAVAATCWDCEYGEDDEGGQALAVAMLGVGAAAYVGGIIHDVATAGDAARAYNRAHGRRLLVAPTMVSSGASQGMGMGLTGTF